MKKHILYECEICHKKSESISEIERCEAKGVFDLSKFPVGTIVNLGREDILPNMTFAIAEVWHWPNDPHLGHSALWACRDGNYGDSLGDEKCGGQFLPYKAHNKVGSTNTPHFKRMVNWLRTQNIPVRVWNGKEAVLYEGD